MTVVALVLAALASLIHVYIFVMESLIWTGPRARKTFGTTVEEAHITKALAFNQGFYNLFLAVVTVIGIVFIASGNAADDATAAAVGAALLFTGAGSMVLAGTVLLLSSSDKRRAALVQAVPPLLAVVALLVAVVG
jgi:putative membrane protein